MIELSETQRVPIQAFLQKIVGDSDGTPKVIGFLSTDSHDGANVRVAGASAQVLADCTHFPVCVIDLNFGTSTLASYFSVDARPNETDSIIFRTATSSWKTHRIGSTNLYVITCDTTRRQSSAEESELELIQVLKKIHTYVFVAIPPRRVKSQSQALNQCVDSLVLVLSKSVSSARLAQKIMERLRSSGVLPAGVIMEKSTAISFET